jgi:hypothetical protein
MAMISSAPGVGAIPVDGFAEPKHERKYLAFKAMVMIF